jgi:serine/threonine protein kinase
VVVRRPQGYTVSLIATATANQHLTCEPGTRLGSRYRLEDRIGGGSGWAAWKAIDETLARAVTVLAFARGFPRIADVVLAARAVGRLTDARLAQVYDVEEDLDHAYLVMEWAGGDSLDDLLADGPLEPEQAGEIIAQSAEALAAAHAAEVAHLCLTPGCVRWTPGGGRSPGWAWMPPWPE